MAVLGMSSFPESKNFSYALKLSKLFSRNIEIRVRPYPLQTLNVKRVFLIFSCHHVPLGKYLFNVYNKEKHLEKIS